MWRDSVDQAKEFSSSAPVGFIVELFQLSVHGMSKEPVSTGAGPRALLVGTSCREPTIFSVIALWLQHLQ
jgi:hypothetical protein